MEEKQSPLVKSASTYGLYLGLISIFLSIIIWVGGIVESSLYAGIIVGLLYYVITLILLVVFGKSYRNKELNGFIRFVEAFKFTFLVIVVSTVISLAYNYVFHTLIAPDYMENMMAVLQEKTMAYMERIGAPEATIDQALEKFEEPITILKTLRQTLLNGLIGGGIIALIASAIIKKRDDSELIA